MTSDELVPVGMQTPCSVRRGWLEGARAGPTKVSPEQEPYMSKCKVLDIGLTFVTLTGAALHDSNILTYNWRYVILPIPGIEHVETGKGLHQERDSTASFIICISRF